MSGLDHLIELDLRVGDEVWLPDLDGHWDFTKVKIAYASTTHLEGQTSEGFVVRRTWDQIADRGVYRECGWPGCPELVSCLVSRTRLRFGDPSRPLCREHDSEARDLMHEGANP